MKRTFLQSLALYATVIFTLVMILFPVYWLLVTALSTTDELYRLPPTFWPDDPQWDIFARVWAAKPILLWLWNSMLAAIGSRSAPVMRCRVIPCGAARPWVSSS